ncbi:MAG: asparaginase [Salinivirgaceae bacterium]|nr:asparaginase [Salinivirgaceae bacterium]MDD4746939.1 asparaginase [Salinivirgaceae bacterium]MDY0280216.1 asparaginase [Salinivirgaceae bacterium]
MNVNKDMSTRPEILVNVTRGALIESRHYGHISVVDNKGVIIASVGDPFYRTYMRSAAKPLQTMAVVLSGAADRFQLSESELAVMSASHYGEPCHQEAVRSILVKIGCKLEDLLCASAYSINHDYAIKEALKGNNNSPLYNDCSGKHAGMLAVCKHKGWDTSNYLNEDHPLQKYIVEIIAMMCDVKPDEINIATDGCGAPVHGIPLYNMALAFARFANPDELGQQEAKACQRIYDAMVKNPIMISGVEGFCTQLIKHANGKLIGKVGAEAVYVVGIKKYRLGVAIKLEDGNLSRIAPAVVQTLKELKVLDDQELNNLSQFLVIENKNKHGNVVGEIFPGFALWT